MSNVAVSRRRVTLPSESVVLLLLIVLIVLLGIVEPAFISIGNINNIIRAAAIPVVLGIGMTFAILTGGIDLSVGSVLAVSGVFLAILSNSMPITLAMVITLIAGTLIAGGLNGSLIGILNLNSFVVTLAAFGLFRGIAYLVTNGATQSVAEPGAFITIIGDGNIGPIPGPLLVMIVVGLLSSYILRYTYFGRDVYAVGGNEVAAQLAGINTKSVKVTVYFISAACATLAGIMSVGRMESAAPTAGSPDLLLAVVAGVLLGGTRLSGGVGSIAGTVIGIFFLTCVSNALTIIGVSSYWQPIATGVLLIAALLFDRIRLESSGRVKTRKER
ncbi:MAG: ABC transporter permease [Actinomycetales bacterium]